MDFVTLENALSAPLKSRWEALLGRFSQMESALVAFSGGVDSGLLSVAAYRVLERRMLAVTIHSPVETLGDLDSARTLAEQVGFPWRVIEHDDLCNPQFTANPPARCYICKLHRFRLLRRLADEENKVTLVEGSNADDLNDYRPGRMAVLELGAVSPLQELNFCKSEIRALAKALGLSIAERPSDSCLATRFPYGSLITRQGLHQVLSGERYLREQGFRLVRLRHHGLLARIEVAPDEIERLVAMRDAVAERLKSLGFGYVTIDVEGYRMGSLNEVLK